MLRLECGYGIVQAEGDVPSRLGSRIISSIFWASLGPVSPSIEAGELIMLYRRKTNSNIVAPAIKRMGFAMAMAKEECDNGYGWAK